jgi:hypothetical protein
MLRCVALVRNDASEERVASIKGVTRIGEVGKSLVTVFLRSVLRLLVTANVVPASPILVTLMTEAMLSSETYILTAATRRAIPEDGILHSHRRENLKPYTVLTDWALQRRGNVSCEVRTGVLCSRRRHSS